MKNKKLQPEWPEDRLRELEDLRRLLTEVTLINRGNCALERIRECIEIAERLWSTDFDTGRVSFFQFLIGKAWLSGRSGKDADA